MIAVASFLNALYISLHLLKLRLASYADSISSLSFCYINMTSETYFDASLRTKGVLSAFKKANIGACSLTLSSHRKHLPHLHSIETVIPLKLTHEVRRLYIKTKTWFFLWRSKTLMKLTVSSSITMNRPLRCIFLPSTLTCKTERRRFLVVSSKNSLLFGRIQQQCDWCVLRCTWNQRNRRQYTFVQR